MNFYGLICTVLGVRPSEVEEMPVEEASLLMSYWNDSPPIHVMLKGFFGVGSQGSSEEMLDGDGLVALLGG